MWLKQCAWFDLSSPLLLEGEALEDALMQNKAYEPHATQTKSLGWESPIGKNHPLAVTMHDYTWMVARLDQKLLPANVVNNKLKERLEQIEVEQGYKATGKQRRVARDELILDLLPKAFVQSKRIQVVVDHKNQVMMLDQTSANIKDMIVELLKKTLTSCPMTHHGEQKSKSGQILKNWVSEAPEGVEVESEYTLINPNNVHVKARMVGMEESMVMAPLQSGMSVSQLMVSYQDKVRFQLNDTLDISRIRYLNVEEAEKLDDPVEQALTEFSLSVSYITDVILALKEWFPITQKEQEEELDVVE